MFQIEKVFAMIGFIACLYAFLGIIGLSLYSVERRSKEISIRKVFGASSLKVLKTLYNEYIVLIGFSFVIALPVTYYLTSNFLEFAWTFRTEIRPEIFGIIYSLFAISVTVCVLYQTLKAANSNPVDSLRQE